MLKEEHLQIRESVREFVEREVVPIADELDNAEKEIPLAVIGKMAELGYFGLIFPPEYGGMGLDSLSMAIVTEELSRGWLSVGSVMTRMIITGTLIMANGTEEQKKKFLPKICVGRDADGGRLHRAGRRQRHRVDEAARGTKRAIGTSSTARRPGAPSPIARTCLTVLARTNPEVQPPHKGLSLLLVEKQPGDGFHPPELAGGPIPTIGYKGMKSYSLGFDGFSCPAREPARRRRGASGFYQLMATYEYARIQTAARAVGTAQASYEAALKYAQERVQFGHPIADFQVIRHKLAHAATRDRGGAAAHATTPARRRTRARARDLEAGMAKVFAAEMAERVTSEMMQIFGGYGYSREYPAQRFWRDARVFRIFEGTSEIQYEVIAKRLLGGK